MNQGTKQLQGQQVARMPAKSVKDAEWRGGRLVRQERVMLLGGCQVARKIAVFDKNVFFLQIAF